MTGQLSALGAALVWALQAILIKTQTKKIDTISLNALQYFFAALFFFIILAPSGGLREVLALSAALALSLVGTALLSMGAGDTMYIRSLGLIGVAKAFPIAMCVHAFLASAVAIVFLGEKFTLGFAGGAVLVIAGIYLIAVPKKEVAPEREEESARRNRMGVLLALLAACCWAMSLSLLKILMAKADVLAAAMVRLPAAGLALMGLASLRRGLKLRTYGLRSIGIVALAGIVGVGLGTILILFAIQQAGAARTAILSSTSPLFAVPLAILLLREKVTWRVILGTLACIAGIMLVII
jgi:DME family drug/metabolite transporter